MSLAASGIITAILGTGMIGVGVDRLSVQWAGSQPTPRPTGADLRSRGMLVGLGFAGVAAASLNRATTPMEVLVWIALGCLLAAVGLLDARTLQIPLRLPVLGAVASVAWWTWSGGLQVGVAALLDGLVLAGMLTAVRIAGDRGWRRRMMGFADPVLMLFVGSMLGVAAGLTALGYGLLFGLAAYVAANTPSRAGRTAAVAAAAVGVFVAVVLGGQALAAMQVMVAVGALLTARAGGRRSGVSLLPLGAWIALGGVVAMVRVDPVFVLLQDLLPWHPAKALIPLP